MQVYRVPVSAPIHATITPPGSKSITNRALICAALTQGKSFLTGVLDSEDTQVMITALKQLGVPVDHDLENNTIEIEGNGGKFPVKNAEIYVANSGTTARFLTAMLAASPTRGGVYRIHGKERMHERPIGDLLLALQNLGADVRSERENDCPPLVIGPNGSLAGETSIPGTISSQFLSAILMVAPAGKHDITLRVSGELVSKPYIAMTLEVMKSFGATIDFREDFSEFCLPAGSRYEPTHYSIEPDASAASYFFAAAAITGGTVRVEGLTEKSFQGDIDFCRCLERMGCTLKFGETSATITGLPLHGIDVDMNAISDTVMTLGVVALFAEGPTRIRNVAHIRHKETDRIAALACELRKLGAAIEEKEDGLIITPQTLHGAEIDTYDDHRMAMSFAIAGLKIPGVVIRDPLCVAKTYPRFFEDLNFVINDNTDQ